MKKFVIETNQNYLDVMKKILSECEVSGNLHPEIRTYIEQSQSKNKPYICKVSGNNLSIEMKIPYRNSFTSTMYLEILINENKTRINGSISSILSSKFIKKIFGFLVLTLSIYILIQQFGFKDFDLPNWISILVAVVLFLSSIPLIFDAKTRKKNGFAEEPYGVQMEHWISNLFPGEFKMLEK